MTETDEYNHLRNRRRGTTSPPCPVCGADTRVRKTWRSGDRTNRERACKSESCGNKFVTWEEAAGK